MAFEHRRPSAYFSPFVRAANVSDPAIQRVIEKRTTTMTKRAYRKPSINHILYLQSICDQCRLDVSDGGWTA